jgi:ribosomal protein S18 acetylase RimI-like enzyme
LAEVAISVVREDDLDDLLPLMRGYCNFYETAPSDEALLGLSRALIASPELDGIQLLARTTRSDDGKGADSATNASQLREAVGFATIYWTWSTTEGPGRLAVMNDLFVAPKARGDGVAEALIDACRERARARGAVALQWETALDNERAQKVYDRVGGERSQWLTYSLPLG